MKHFILLSLLLFPTISWSEPVDFSLPDLDAKQVNLSDYRGKWVVVNYWATWCPPCLREIPELIAFHEDHQDKDAFVLGVAMEDIKLDKLKQFVDEYFINYPVLRMKPAPRSELGLITGLPTSFLISPAGEVIAQQTGPVSATLIEEFIAKQIDDSKKSSADSKAAMNKTPALPSVGATVNKVKGNN